MDSGLGRSLESQTANTTQRMFEATMRVPDVGFYHSHEYERVKDAMDTAGVVTIILKGHPGVGKTECARRICQHMKDKFGNEVIEAEFSCTTGQQFVNSMVTFRNSVDIGGKLTQVDHFEYLYEYLNQNSRANKRKVFLFDDVTQQSGILDQVIMKYRSRLDGEAAKEFRDKWLFIVTMKEEVPVSADALKIINMEGFNLEDTTNFMKQSGTDDEAMVKAIQDEFQGLPLALRFAAKELKYQDNVNEWLNQVKESARGRFAGTPTTESARIYAIIHDTIVRCLKSQERDRPHLNDVLKIISCYDRTRISIELLVSVVETVQDTTDGNLKVSRVVSMDILRTLCDALLITYDNKGRQFDTHYLIRETLKLTITEDEKLKICRLAMISLYRVMDRDGRHHEASYMTRDSHLAQALKLIEFWEDILKHTNGPQDKCCKLLNALICAAVGYHYLNQRNGHENGEKFLNKSLDSFTSLLTNDTTRSYEELSFGGLSELEIGSILFEMCEDFPLNDEMKKFIKEVQIFQRLSKRDQITLFESADETTTSRNLTSTKHILPSILPRLQESRKALPPELMQKIFIPEMLASVFGYHATVYTKVHKDHREPNQPTENETEQTEMTFLKTSLKHAIIAQAILNTLREKFGQMLLQKIIIERDRELHIKMSMIDDYTAEDLLTLINKYEVLEQVGGRAYECGLVRSSDLQSDSYHKIRCREGMMIVRGHLFKKTKRQDYYDLGKIDMREIEELAGTDPHRERCLSSVKQKEAEFFHLCEENGSAILAVISSMQSLSLSVPKKTEEHDEIKKSFFKELCHNLEKYLVEHDDWIINSDSPDLRDWESMIHYLAGLIKVIENAHHLSDIDYHRTLDQDTEKWRKRLRTLRWAHDKLCEGKEKAANAECVTPVTCMEVD